MKTTVDSSHSTGISRNCYKIKDWRVKEENTTKARNNNYY